MDKEKISIYLDLTSIEDISTGQGSGITEEDFTFIDNESGHGLDKFPHNTF